MTDMTEIIERANSAGFRVMEDARYGKPDECVDWEGVFDRVANTIIATLAAGMAEAELKVVGTDTAMDALGAGYNALVSEPPWDASQAPWVGAAWEAMHAAATCELQRVMKGDG